MRARRLKSAVLSGGTEEELQDAINQWFAASGQSEFYAIERLSSLSVVVLFIPASGAE